MVGHNSNDSNEVSVTFTAPPQSPPPSSGGGGGGGGSSCTVSTWTCEEWNNCENEVQTRTCTSNCNTKKTEKQNCTLEIDTPSNIEENNKTATEQKSFLTLATGGVIGTLGTAGSIVALAFIALVIGGLIFVRFRKKEE